MAAIETTIPPKGLGSIQAKDFLKGLYYAASGQILALIYFAFSQLFTEHPHWPLWVEWLPYLKATVIAFAGYIFAKFGVNNVGQIFQKDRAIVHVDAVELKELEAKVEAK